jgi:hypothetical protein
MWDGDPLSTVVRGGPADDVLVPQLSGRVVMVDIEPDCGRTEGGWRCTVTLRDPDSTSTHDVSVSDDDAARLAAATTDGEVERLLYETFDFLLERESKEQILSAFDLSVVSRYFPEYEHEIQSRLAP